ncbi:hypothetical protein FB451DRAFT_1056175, partial [Mycena latifolia]
DPLNTHFGADWARLTRDLLFDGEGNLQFKKILWEDVHVVILPALIEHVGYVPIPHVEYTDAALDLVIENLTLAGRTQTPPARLRGRGAKLRPSQPVRAAARDEVQFPFAQIQADMCGVAFWFQTKSGIRMSDVTVGRADVLMASSQATVMLASSAAPDPASVFPVTHVRVTFGALRFRIRDSTHDLFIFCCTRCASRSRRASSRRRSGALHTACKYAARQLVGVRDRVAEAHACEGGWEEGGVLYLALAPP